MNRHLLAALALGLIACSDDAQQPGTGPTGSPPTAPCDTPPATSSTPTDGALPAASLLGNWRVCGRRAVDVGSLPPGGRLLKLEVVDGELQGIVQPSDGKRWALLAGSYDPARRTWSARLTDYGWTSPPTDYLFSADGRRLSGESLINTYRDTITGGREDGTFTCPDRD
jgi:hypothetical protein